MSGRDGGDKRPIIRGGQLNWVPPSDASLGHGFVPFAGTGRRLGGTGPALETAGTAHGPLSQTNIDYLRRQAEGRPSRFLGVRHTTDEFDRRNAASSGNVARPGFHGDAYALVPETDIALRQRFPHMAAMANRGFQGNDQQFNSAVRTAIGNSIDWDMPRAPGANLGAALGHMAQNTQFAVANMGGAPRQDAHDKYSTSTAKFGKRTVSPRNVSFETGVSPERVTAVAHAAARVDPQTLPHDRASYERVRGALVDEYGQAVNTGLDRMRAREVMAAAAESRLLQQQGRGRPDVRARNQARLQALQDTVHRGP